MSYFSQSHDQLSYIYSIDGLPGLRRSQIGAIHAISAHFTIQSRPAVIVLPTGAGKTAVLMLSPFVLRAERVLVITQSRFVRDQIVRDFRRLHTIKLARALPENLPAPSLYENKNVIQSIDLWNTLRQYDVVVSTPNSCSPAHKTIPLPPSDLFDLVLIDEAHHSPAPTWNAVIDAFPGSRCILFTATPFRRDGKEIKGRYIYNYPIQRAFDDGIFGEMTYIPVHPEKNMQPDVALARETERIFLQDRSAGYSHILMVRADSRPRANELAQIYRQQTSLHLEIVHSGVSQKTAERTVERLRLGELDGVICVNMLGEGFDLPNLKIAALHAPHRSLAVTLQFFGRFARVNGERLGEAKFLAVETEIKNELAELFQESEAWGRTIRAVGQERIGEEVFTREFLDDFHLTHGVRGQASLDDLSLYTFNVFNHVKIFKVYGTFNLIVDPELSGFTTEKVWINEPRSTLVFLVREEQRPKWMSTNHLNRVEHHLIILYYNEATQLLFICATYREETIYKEVASIFIDGHAISLSLNKINRTLRSITNLELFNVGMRNRASGLVAETYRQLAGSAVHDSIDKGDGALYHRGHIFGRGRTSEGITTIGLSSLSKIWRLEYTKIPKLVSWCQGLAKDIENPAPFITGIGLDHLDAGRDLTILPEVDVLAADWQDRFYQDPPIVHFQNPNENETTFSILDCDLLIDKALTNADQIVVVINNGHHTTRLRFSVIPFPDLEYIDDNQPRIMVERGIHEWDLVKFLNENPLRFHLADGSLLEGCQLFEAPDEGIIYDTDLLMRVVNWDDANVDVQKEYGECKLSFRSIHDWLCEILVTDITSIVFYDHRPGECADFLTLSEDEDGRIMVSLYHCKAAGGTAAGDRISDLDQVCGQVTKSTQWRSKKRLINHVKDRFRTGSSFVKGDLAAFMRLMEPYPRYEVPLEVYIVQPGVSKEHLSEKMAALLATASRGLVAVGCQRLKVICSE